jgi:DNA-directed RNA polymerase subunit K/omega
MQNEPRQINRIKNDDMNLSEDEEIIDNQDTVYDDALDDKVDVAEEEIVSDKEDDDDDEKDDDEGDDEEVGEAEIEAEAEVEGEGVEVEGKEEKEVGKEKEYDEEYEDEDTCIYRYADAQSDSDEEAELVFDDDDINQKGIIPKEERITKPILTKYERVRLKGDRAKQITLGAKIMLKNVDDLNPKEITDLEIKNNIIPLIIERPLPNGEKERWYISELKH